MSIHPRTLNAGGRGVTIIKAPRARDGSRGPVAFNHAPIAPIFTQQVISKKRKVLSPGMKKPGLHFYCRELAKELNPKQHDITAAVVLYNISLWQNNNFRQTIIDGKRHSFRSLSDLQNDHPYLTESAIHKALIRLETKLPGEFLIRRDKNKLWFHVGDKTREQQKKSTLNSFYSKDAIDAGSVRSAVLLANLKYSLGQFTDPKTDARRNKYAELSPKKLCPILNFSEDTIARSLKDLCQESHIIRHEQFPSFYALAEGFVRDETVLKCEKATTAEVNSESAKVHTRTAEVHTETAEVHRYEGTDINESLNECLKEDIKGRIKTSSASPRGLIFLQKILQAKRCKNDTGSGHIVRGTQHISRVDASLLPYDMIVSDEDMPYDHVAAGHEFFHEWVKNQVKDMRWHWQNDGQILDKDDAIKLQRLFHDNPRIDAGELYGLYAGMKIDSPLHICSGKKALKKRPRLLKKVTTPKSFLKYLPQIIVMSFLEPDEDFKFVGDLDEPWDSFNYAYLGKEPNSKLVRLQGEQVPKVYVDDYCIR